jgi:hypothetical protein
MKSGSGEVTFPAEAQRMRLIWSAAASGIPHDAAFRKLRKAVPPVGCHRTPETIHFRDFRVFRGENS